jgi:ParB-like chromosome segregation protein Spo0J
MERTNIKMKALEAISVDLKDVYANDYNPNVVAKPEMELLKTSIVQNGFCFPIVVIKDKKNKYCVVDGFHRYTVMKDYLKQDKIAVVVLDQTIEERITATVQFNRARGTHQILDMSKLVLKLIKQGLTDSEIMKKMGMDAEEVLRLKQITGLKEAFSNRDFSKSYEELKEKLKK